MDNPHYLFSRVVYVTPLTEPGTVERSVYRNTSVFASTVITVHAVGSLGENTER